MLKNRIRPCDRVARIAPPSQSATLVVTTVRSASRPPVAATTARWVASGSRRSVSIKAVGDPERLRAPQRLGARIQPDHEVRPVPPPAARRTATAGRLGRCPARTRSGRAAPALPSGPARQPHRTSAIAASRGMSFGRRVNRPLANRIACPSTATWDALMSMAPILRRASGVRVSETSVQISSPTATPPLGKSGPISATRPTSTPPDPVTGLCILPRARTISAIRVRMRSWSWAQLSAICRMRG